MFIFHGDSKHYIMFKGPTDIAIRCLLSSVVATALRRTADVAASASEERLDLKREGDSNHREESCTTSLHC